MANNDYFLKFILKGDFTWPSIEKFKELLSINNKQLIRKSFKFLNSEIGIIKNNKHFNKCISNAVILISTVCNNEEFNEEDVLINKKRIKKARDSLLAYSNKFKNQVLLEAANNLDEIVLDKNINVEDLINLIKELINRKEDINIIKKFLSTNKGAIILDNNVLFDDVFNLAIKSIHNNDPIIFYYITLLKVFYSSKINKKEYVDVLNNLIDSENHFAHEIYYIIHGQRRNLSSDEIIDKYGIIENLPFVNIPDLNKKTKSDLVFTLDSSKTILKDDAISLKIDGNKYIVGIHITDPTYLIKYNSQLDLVARNNYQSLYLPDRQIKMYDSIISSSMSLDKNKLKNVISLYVTFNSDIQIEDYSFTKNTINIDENLDFASGDVLLEGFDKTYTPLLRNLFDISLELEKSNPSKKLYWQKKDLAQHKLHSTYKCEKIISELMVLYNYLIAQLTCDNSIPYVYRTQDAAYLQNLVKKYDITLDEANQNLIKSIFLPSKYSIIPQFHNGIHLPYYSHSTAPLRRYPDLYNVFLLHHFYFQDFDLDFSYIEYVELVNYFNQRNVELSLMKSEYERTMVLKKE